MKSPQLEKCILTRNHQKSVPKVWIILFLLLLTTSARPCPQHSRKLGTTLLAARVQIHFPLPARRCTHVDTYPPRFAKSEACRRVSSFPLFHAQVKQQSRAQILEFGHSSLTDARPFVGLLCRQLWLPLTQEVRTIGTQTLTRLLAAAAAASMPPPFWCHSTGEAGEEEATPARRPVHACRGRGGR